MTPGRFILILAVIVVVLFGVSLAMQNRTKNNRTNPTNSWVSQFNKRFEEWQKIKVATDLESDCLNGNRLIIVGTTPGTKCTVNVLPSRDKKRSVRKAKLQVSGSDIFAVSYEPSANDPEAVRLAIEKFDSKRALQMVFLKHGGTLTFVRKSLGSAGTVISIE